MQQTIRTLNHHLLSILGIPILQGLLFSAYLLDVITLNVLWASLHVTFLMMVQVALDIRKGVKVFQQSELMSAGIERLDSPVFLANPAHKIIFKNKAYLSLEANASVPSYPDLTHLLAQGLFRFSKLPYIENQVQAKKLLKSLKAPYQTQILLGERAYPLLLTPIFNAKQNRLGTLAEWQTHQPSEHATEDLRILKDYINTIKIKQHQDDITLTSKRPGQMKTREAAMIVDKIEQFNQTFSQYLANTLQIRLAKQNKLYQEKRTHHTKDTLLQLANRPEQQLQSMMKQFKVHQARLNQTLAEIRHLEKQLHKTHNVATLAKLKENLYQAVLVFNQNLNQLEGVMKSLQRLQRVTDQFDTVILNAKTSQDIKKQRKMGA